MELSREQQQAVAMANARLRLQQQQSSVEGTSAPLNVEPVSPLVAGQQTPATQAEDIPETPSELPVFDPQSVETDPTKKVTDTPFEDLYKKPENLSVIRDYATARYGKSGEQLPNETDEAYTKRFMSAMRQVEWNTSINASQELNWIYNAKKEDALKAAKAFKLYDNTASWYDKGGQKGIMPFAESLFSAVSEPTNLISLGIGAAARQQAAKQGIKLALNQKLKAIAAGSATDAVLGIAESAVSLQRDLKNNQILDNNAVEQQSKIAKDLLDSGQIDQEQFDTYTLKQQAKVKEINARQISKSEAAIGGLIGVVTGGISARSALRSPKMSLKQEVDDILKARKSPPQKADPNKQALIDAFDQNMDETNRQFDIFEGRKILDDLNPPTSITQAEIKTDINTRAINVAKVILLEDPNFSALARRVGTGQQKVSSAVSEVFSSLDKVDDVALQRAIDKEGLTLQEFSKVTGTTVSDAASIMQTFSSLKRVLTTQAQLDPDAQRIIDNMYLRDEWGVPDVLITLKDGANRVERETKAWLVGSFATTARNVIGTTTGLTFNTGANFIESSLYQTGKVLKSVKEGTYKAGDLSAGLNTVVRDTFNTLTYLANSGITSEVVDRLLVDNPKIQNMLFSALQETGTQKITQLSKMVNTFNVAQDAIFRKAIFTASVERQLRRVGMDMYKIMADGKAIPTDVIKNASDDALKGTFSYAPKQGVASHFVKFWEQLPGGSLLVTFPRFMTNAMAFQYKYSLVGAVFGGVDLARGALHKNPEAAARLTKEGLDKFSKGMVGTGVLAFAVDYRSNHPDSPWYAVTGEDGSTVDTRVLFPIAPYLALAEFIIKGSKANTSEIMQTVVGMKLPSGAQGYLIDRIAKAMENTEGKDAEKLQIGLGSVFGDVANRFLQPGQPIFTFFELFNTESQKARDPNIILSDSLITESALNKMRNKVPGLKEDLPEAKRQLRQETPVRAAEFFNTLMGVRVVPQANKLEREFVRLNLEPYKIFGTTGDKVLDRAVLDQTAPFINKRVIPLLESERYANRTDEEKSKTLRNVIGKSVIQGRRIASLKMERSDKQRMDKLVFNKMSSDDRRLVNELYAKDNDGKTIDENKDYRSVYQYQLRLPGYQ